MRYRDRPPTCSILGCQAAPEGGCYCAEHAAELIAELERLGWPRRSRVLRRWLAVVVEVLPD